MKGSSLFKLTKGLELLLFTFGVVMLLYLALPDNYYSDLYVEGQLQQEQQLPPVIGIKITSPVINQVPVGQLTISGTSTDNAASDCTVYVDWNNTKPFQKATATGSGGVSDYSTWSFTFTDKYHLITNGTNNLTSKLSCLSDGNNGVAANITKNYSVNVIGVMEPSQRSVSSSEAAEQQNNLTGSVSSSPLPSLKEDNNNNTKKATTTTNPESIPSVPITPSPVPPSSPSIQEQKPEGNDNVVQKVEPQPQPAPGDNSGTTIYWDIQ